MKLNKSATVERAYTHEGGRATPTDNFNQLKRSVLTCMLWEDTFYEKGSAIAARIAELVPKVKPEQVAALACEARDRMNLRHVPLFLVRELARYKGNGTLVADTLEHVIQRADELAEFLAMYWRDKRQPLSAGVKRGLARAFPKFDAYRLAKYNGDNAIKLRDVLFLTHPHPEGEHAEALPNIWKKLVDGKLASPDTWEVALSAGKDKRETFERLLREGKLGGLATLRNLRNMVQSGVDVDLIRTRLKKGCERAFPYRFVTAARYVPQLEDAIEQAMYKAVEQLEALPGKTGILIDVSGSMDGALATNSKRKRSLTEEKPTTRLDVAAGLAILLREKAEEVYVATFSNAVKEVPARRGFALRDAVQNSQMHGGTELRKAVETLRSHFAWKKLDRMIIVTDEQSSDGIANPWIKRKSYVVNVAPYAAGVSYRNGWHHIDGWSEYVIDYIREHEQMEAE